MGLTVRVQNHFEELLTGSVQNEIDEVKSVIDEHLVKEVSFKRLLEYYGISRVLSDIKKMNALDVQISRLQRESRDLDNEIERTIRMNVEGVAHYSPVSQAERIALKEYRTEVIKELYGSEVLDEVARLEEIKSKITTAILISTTEKKLTANLLTVVEHYGGDVAGLKELLAKME